MVLRDEKGRPDEPRRLATVKTIAAGQMSTVKDIVRSQEYAAGSLQNNRWTSGGLPATYTGTVAREVSLHMSC